MHFTEIDYERLGPVRIIRFNRPEVRNCVGPTADRELIDAECFFRSIHQPETLEGLRRFRERDHPDLRCDPTAHDRTER